MIPDIDCILLVSILLCALFTYLRTHAKNQLTMQLELLLVLCLHLAFYLVICLTRSLLKFIRSFFQGHSYELRAIILVIFAGLLSLSGKRVQHSAHLARADVSATLSDIPYHVCGTRDAFPVPWKGMLPSRALNFFMGDQNCQVSHFKSTVDIRCYSYNVSESLRACRNQTTCFPVLSVQCTAGRGQVTDWSTHRKAIRENSYDTFAMRQGKKVSLTPILRQFENITEFTMNIPRGIENVVVKCGDETRRHIFFNRFLDHRICHSTFASTANGTQSLAREVDQVSTKRPKSPQSTPNVLLVILDAMSRPFFNRALPKTKKLLQTWRREFQHPSRGNGTPTYTEPGPATNSNHTAAPFHVLEFLRYHIVGMSTTGNMVPMFTGYPTPADAIPGYNNGTYLSSIAKTSGYYSALLHGMCAPHIPELSHVGNGSLGWDVPDAHENFCLAEYPETEGNFIGPYSLTKRCVTDRHVHEHLMKYTRDLWDTIPADQPKFITAVFLEPHEGTQEVATLMDQDLVDFLRDARFQDGTRFWCSCRITVITWGRILSTPPLVDWSI